MTEIAASRPTHAGMVCFNRAGQVLICNAKGKPDEWVLPKGHIENGEESYEAAQREVAEEAGVLTVTDTNDPLVITISEQQVVIEWWTGLADRVLDNVTPDRPSKWVSWGRGLKMLTYNDQKSVLKMALAFK